MKKYTDTELYKYLTKEQNNNIFDISDILIPFLQKLGYIVNNNFFKDVYSYLAFEVIICEKDNTTIKLIGINDGEPLLLINVRKKYKFIDDISLNNILNELNLLYLYRKEKLDYIQSL